MASELQVAIGHLEALLAKKRKYAQAVGDRREGDETTRADGEVAGLEEALQVLRAQARNQASE